MQGCRNPKNEPPATSSSQLKPGASHTDLVTPEIGRDYIGPHGWLFRVLAIEDNGGYPLVVIRDVAQSKGAIRFPLWQTEKWLGPV